MPLVAYMSCRETQCSLEWATFPVADFGTCRRHVEQFDASPEVTRLIERLVAVAPPTASGLYSATVRFYGSSRPPRTVTDFGRSMATGLLKEDGSLAPGVTAHELERALGSGWLRRLDDDRALESIQADTLRAAGEARLLSALRSAFHWGTFLLLAALLVHSLHHCYRALFIAVRKSRRMFVPIATQASVAGAAVLLNLGTTNDFILHALLVPVAVFAIFAELASAAWLAAASRSGGLASSCRVDPPA